MAESKKKTNAKKKNFATVDAIYEKYARGVIRTLASSDFYDFFMDMIDRAENEFQFSNLRQEKIIDPKWVDAVDKALSSFQNIVSNPRNIIKEEEIIVNVAHAKRSDNDVVRHLAQHGNFVSSYDENTKEVLPNRLMQKLRDDSDELYENRFVYTVLEATRHFVKIRYDALFDVLGDEFGAKLKLTSDLESATEIVHFDMNMHIKEKQSTLEIEEKSGELLSAVARLYRVLTMLMSTPFAVQMARLPRVKGSITKTNVLKKNPDYRAIMTLWEFLKKYNDVGYVIQKTAQSPVITPAFQKDLYHNIMYQYIVLKGYLEKEEERRLPAPATQKKKKLKPKFIREIVEELTQDYDLPDVEVRKVLIEELTKEQLMQEEAAERRRLVEEREKREREEAERIRRLEEEKQEQIRQKEEAERLRLQREREAEEERKRLERLRQENRDRKLMLLYKKELDKFSRNLPDRLEEREKALKKNPKQKQQDFSDAALKLEREEERRLERAKKERLLKKQEAERMELARREAELLAEEKRKEEEIRQAKLDEEIVSVFRDLIALFPEERDLNLKKRSEFLNDLKKEKETFEEKRRFWRERKIPDVLQ